MDRFKECLEIVLEHEGGWADHPKDPGGATNRGVTIGTFRRYYPGATKEDLRNITSYQLQKIYKEGYWNPIDGDGLGPGVDLAVFDLAVNSGVGRAKKMFREVMQWHNIDNRFLINQLRDNRMAFLRSLRHWGTFGKGWTRRVEDIRAKSLQALGKPVQKPKKKEVPTPTPKAKTLWVVLLELLWRIFVR